MTIKCNEKLVCGFHMEQEICIFCQTKLKGTDRKLRQVNESGSGNGNGHVNGSEEHGERSLFDSMKDGAFGVVWTL